jgi:hypothetical protein
VYNEPDWSSLTLPELLEKALEFGNKAYSGSLITYAFLERALEKSPKRTDMTDEILNMTDRAKQAYQLLAELNRDITSLAQEFPKPVKYTSQPFLRLVLNGVLFHGRRHSHLQLCGGVLYSQAHASTQLAILKRVCHMPGFVALASDVVL